MDQQQFDFEAFKKQAASRLKKGGRLLGKDGVLKPLLKEFLEGELEAHIEDEGEANRKNGKGRKQVKTPKDPAMLKRLNDIASFPEEDRLRILYMLDALIKNVKLKQMQAPVALNQTRN